MRRLRLVAYLAPTWRKRRDITNIKYLNLKHYPPATGRAGAALRQRYYCPRFGATPHRGFITKDSEARFHGPMVEDTRARLDGKPIGIMQPE